MLLTPRIIRTHELRAWDLSPIYIGTQSNMALTGPPVTIGGPPEPETASATASPPRARLPPARRPGIRSRQPSRGDSRRDRGPREPVIPPGSSAIPGTTGGARTAGDGGAATRGPTPTEPPPVVAPRNGARRSGACATHRHTGTRRRRPASR